ncbi:MAG TPA: hypothetical protein VGR47_19210 [Terracidiphilus sp.]|nr:hypothetical protein [Terracidiphilus sp.]
MNPFRDLFRRLRRSLGLVAAQYWVMLVLIGIGVAWTRLPDQYWWQVFLSLLIPTLLIAALLALDAATMRSVAGGADSKHVRLMWGALALAVWAAIYAAIWIFLNWCAGHIRAWASYLNSRASAHARASFFTYDHIQNWLIALVWIFRWIIVPGKLIPCAIASAQFGWRLPWRRLIRFMLNWRWWPAVILASLIAVEWPSHFYNAIPQGSVSQQVWAVLLKLLANYLLAITSWILLLAWAAVLISPRPQSADDALVPAPIGSAPLGEDSVRLPLPEAGNNPAGNA